MRDFDLAVIGAGPGGLDAALRARELGLKVALIEKKEPGGTCLNTGCIPTKALLSSSRVLSEIKRASEYGLRADNANSEFDRILERKDEVVSRLRASAISQIQKSGLEWIAGEARFTGPKELDIHGEDQQRLTAKSILIATGSEPVGLPGLALDGRNILSSSDILELKELPTSLLIIGGGAVGVEFASFFHALGVRVTLTEMMPGLLPTEDPDCAKRLESLFQKRGMEIQTGKGDAWKGVKADKTLLAIGRRRNTHNLGLEAAGIGCKKNGAVEVSVTLETNVPGVFAIGDVIDSPQLAHVASYEGALVAENLVNKVKKTADYKAVPSCVYSDPEVASVGILTGEDVETVRIPFAAVAKAQVEGETDGFLKLSASKKTGKIMGASAIGAHVTEIIPEIVLAVRLGLTIDDILGTIHAHPTLAEVVCMAARELARRIKKA